MSQASGPLFALGALAVAGAALAYISFGSLGENLVYYWSPTELIEAGAQAKGATVRLGGMVEPGSKDWKPDVPSLDFRVSDGTTTVPVHAVSSPPQMFREGIGVVVEGTLGPDGVFQADRVMVKHSNEYRSPEDGEAMTDIARTLEGAE